MKFDIAVYPPYEWSVNPYLQLLVGALRSRSEEVARVDDLSLRFPLFSRGAAKIVHLQWIPSASRSLYRDGALGYLFWWRANMGVFVTLLVVWLAKVFAGAKVVWTIHDAPVLDAHPVFMSFFRKIYFYIADGYVIQAESARRDIPARYAQKPVIFCHRPNMIGAYGPIATREESEAMRKYLYIPRDAVVFLVFGFLRIYKNIERVINAFDGARTKHENSYLIVVGHPYDQSAADRIRQVADGAPNIITVLHKIPDHYVRTLFGASDYAVIGQERGYTSGVMFLAMSYSKPVIIRNWGAAPQYVKDGENGFLFEWDTLPAIFERAIALRKNATRYRAMCDAALKTMEPLTWERATDAFVSFYRRLSGFS